MGRGCLGNTEIYLDGRGIYTSGKEEGYIQEKREIYFPGEEEGKRGRHLAGKERGINLWKKGNNCLWKRVEVSIIGIERAICLWLRL